MNDKDIIKNDNKLVIANLENSITSFSKPLAEYLTHIGLPVDNILSPIEERRKVIQSLESAISILPYEDRIKSSYLSKYAIAITIGLFDGALTFLWDETILALKKLVNSYDLQYFFNVAETLNSRYKNLHIFKDLEYISEHDLLEICRRIGLINDINYTRLEYVNYFRNHASSAHANENTISGFEMVSFLETCLNYAIKAIPDHSSIQVKKLLDNIRNQIIPSEDFEHIGNEISRLPKERIHDLLFTIFGMFTDPKQKTDVSQNIESFSKYVWICCDDDIKYQVGSKFGLFRKNGDVDRKNLTNRFLEVVDGLQYKDEDSLAAELITKLQTLKSVHFEWYNFYNEYAHAVSIKESIPANGVIPIAARNIFVKVISICYYGNGKGYKDGTCESAMPYYEEYIKLFTENEVVEFIFLFSDPEFTIDLHIKTPDNRLKNLASILKSKTTNIHILEALEIIISFPEKKLSDIHKMTDYKNKLKYIKHK